MIDKKVIFKGYENLYDRLIYLNSLKMKLQAAKKNITKPILITVMGSPRTGKTSSVFNIYDFLKKAGLNVMYLEEPANKLYKEFKTDEEKKKAIENRVLFNSRLRDRAIEEIKLVTSSDSPEVVLYDRGFLDCYIWFSMDMNDGLITMKEYYEKFMELEDLKLDMLRLTFALYANPNVSIKRDYLNSLSLEDRKFIAEENLEKYLHALFQTRGELESYSDLCHYIDTSDISVMETSINIAENICYNLIANSIGKGKNYQYVAKREGA